MRTGIIQDNTLSFDYEIVMSSEDSNEVMSLLRDCVCESDGLSGRCLRKLPFQAYAMWLCGCVVSLKEYLDALKRSILVRDLSIDSLTRKRRQIAY